MMHISTSTYTSGLLGMHTQQAFHAAALASSVDSSLHISRLAKDINVAAISIHQTHASDAACNLGFLHNYTDRPLCAIVRNAVLGGHNRWEISPLLSWQLVQNATQYSFVCQHHC